MTAANRAGAVEVFAPAKINLCLHVTGRRTDGYHLLDSLVAFAGVGDRIIVEPDPGLTLTVTGPQAAGLTAGPDNLVLRAARAFGAGLPGARITLDKHLPTASGIGGGSADAAAALKALAALWSRPLPSPEAVLALGADVPVCLAGRARRMTGAGETLSEVPPLPPAWIALANPGVAVSTPDVFARLDRRDNPPLPAVPSFTGAAALATWLQRQRNDLEPAALGLAPAIAEALAALSAQPGVLIARMSGSGATCFALFAAETPARAAARALARPGWWTAAAPLLG